MAGSTSETRETITFSFGENWSHFVQSLPQDAVEGAALDIDAWLGPERIRGRSVIDIGCGSGLHSLVFHMRGARSVLSVDQDPMSVAATTILWERAGRPPSWEVRQGSILDRGFRDPAGRFEIVYSWGVLHHTGAMWDALVNASALVAPGGLCWIALYRKGPRYPRDLALKQRYNRASSTRKRLMECRWIARLMRKRLRSGKNPFAWNVRRARGMDTYHDIIDWLGGLPYEVASRDEVVGFFENARMALERFEEADEGGCSVYLFVRPGPSRAGPEPPVAL